MTSPATASSNLDSSLAECVTHVPGLICYPSPRTIPRGPLTEAFNQYPYSFDALRHHGAFKNDRIRCDAELLQAPTATEVLSYRIECAQNRGTQESPTYTIHNEERKVGERVLFSRSDGVRDLKSLTNLHPEDQSIFAAIRRATGFEAFSKAEPLNAHCAKEISRVGRYRFDSRLLSQPGRVFDVEPGEKERATTPRVAYRGEDLASVLYYLSETKDAVLDQITERVGQAINGFEGFEFNRVGSDRVGFSARFSDGRGTVVSPNLSDGCLTMIGLA